MVLCQCHYMQESEQESHAGREGQQEDLGWLQGGGRCSRRPESVPEFVTAIKGLSKSIISYVGLPEKGWDLLKTLQAMGGQTKTILYSDFHALITIYTGARDT